MNLTDLDRLDTRQQGQKVSRRAVSDSLPTTYNRAVYDPQASARDLIVFVRPTGSHGKIRRSVCSYAPFAKEIFFSRGMIKVVQTFQG
jgi:hypothetical protein